VNFKTYFGSAQFFDTLHTWYQWRNFRAGVNMNNTGRIR